MKEMCDLCTLEAEKGHPSQLFWPKSVKTDQGGDNDFIIVFPRICNSAFVTCNFPNLNLIWTVIFFRGLLLLIACWARQNFELVFQTKWGRRTEEGKGTVRKSNSRKRVFSFFTNSPIKFLFFSLIIFLGDKIINWNYETQKCITSLN